ncbi:hypothetical protein V5799_012021, partial [Amblyomma americanum]
MRHLSGNIIAARQYVGDVMRRLVEDPQLRAGVEPSDPLSSCDADCCLRDGFVRGMAIRGLSRIGHDGKPWLKAGQQGFDLAAMLLVRDCEFDACYNFKDGDKQVTGQVCGKVDMVRIDLVIG